MDRHTDSQHTGRFQVRPLTGDTGLVVYQVLDTLDRLRLMVFTRPQLAEAAVRRLTAEHAAMARRGQAS